MQKILFSLLLTGCLSACHTAKECKETVKADCICPMNYDPVCGCNNKTYGNACSAECAGIKTYTKGECPNKKGN